MVEVKAPFAQEELKQTLATELRDKMEEMIDVEVLSAMTAEQSTRYSELLSRQDTSDDMIQRFVQEDCNIDINVAVSSALARVRAVYLGA